MLKKEASFAKFSYVENMADRRNFIRMEPHLSTVVTIDSPFGIFDGALYDISLAGLNIPIQNSCPIERGSKASIRFELGNVEIIERFDINVTAELIDIRGNRLPYNYIFIFVPDKSLESRLSRYIFQRQIEIVREIKNAIS
jgi:PilZ domain